MHQWHVGFSKGLGEVGWHSRQVCVPLGIRAVRGLDWATHSVLFIAGLLSQIWGIIHVSHNTANQNQCLPVTALCWSSLLPKSLASTCRWNLISEVNEVLGVSCVCTPLQDVPCWKAAQDEPGLYHRWCKSHLPILRQKPINTGRTAVYPFTKCSCHLAQNPETPDWLSRCSGHVCWLWHEASPPFQFSHSPKVKSEHFQSKTTSQIWRRTLDVCSDLFCL